MTQQAAPAAAKRPPGIPQLGEEFNFTPLPDAPRAPVQRVAMFAESFLPKIDGVSKTALLTLGYLQQTGRDVLIFAPDTAPRFVGPSEVIPLPSLRMPLYPETRVALPSLLVSSYLDDFEPDLIQLFSPAFLSVAGALTARTMHVPVIGNYQTDLPGYAERYGYPLLNAPIREWLKTMHNLCHLNLAPSHYTIRELRQWGFRRLRHWGRGVNGQRFNPSHRSEAWRQRLLAGRPDDSLLAVYVGRLAKEKQIDLLHGVAKLPGVALTIIGDGPARDELETAFADTDAHFTGYLFGDDLATAYASADLFAFTGTNETFGQVVLEAMASGLPVIVVDSGGVVDMAIPGETGIIVAPETDAFTEAVQQLRDDPALREQLSRGARRYAEARPWEVLMAQLEGYYTEAVALNARYQQMYPAARSPLEMLEEWFEGDFTQTT